MKKRQTFFRALAMTARGFLQTAKPAFMDKMFIFPIALMALLMCKTTAWAIDEILVANIKQTVINK